MKRRRREPATEPHEAVPTDRAATLVIEERLGRVEKELTAAAGGASLCSISKVSGSVPAAKYLEGRFAVLLNLRRRAGTIGEAVAAVHDLKDEWEAELERVTQEDFGPDWRGYRAGGVDELDEIAELLQRD